MKRMQKPQKLIFESYVPKHLRCQPLYPVAHCIRAPRIISVRKKKGLNNSKEFISNYRIKRVLIIEKKNRMFEENTTVNETLSSSTGILYTDAIFRKQGCI